MKNNALILYGAVATPPTSIEEKWVASKIKIRHLTDRVKFKLLKQHSADYRNYASENNYNRGDHAIVQASAQTIRRFLPNTALAPLNWEERETSLEQQAPIAICGSGYFFLNEHAQFPNRMRDDLAWFKRQKLAMIYGSGVNLIDPRLERGDPCLPPDEADFLAEFLEECEHISVRDAASQRLLQSCTSSTVHLVGDPALFIEASNASHVERYLPASRIHIGINLPFHGPSACARINEDFDSYVIAFKEIQKRTDCLFHYMVHYDSELLVAELLQDAGIRLKVVYGDVDDLLHTYKQLNCHIGGMLHSCILSSSTGTPAIGLAYDIKHSGFFNLLGFPEHCIPAQPFDPDRIVSLTLHTLKNEQGLRSTILSRRLALRKKADDFLQSALHQFQPKA